MSYPTVSLSSRPSPFRITLGSLGFPSGRYVRWRVKRDRTNREEGNGTEEDWSRVIILSLNSYLNRSALGDATRDGAD